MGMILRWMARLVAAGLVVYGLTFLAVIGASHLTREAHLDGRSLHGPVDAVLVLGGGGDDHWAPREVLDRRLHTAMHIYKTGRAPVILSSGGGITTFPGVANSGQAYRERLLRYGLAEEDLILEDQSLTTFQNILFSKPLIEAAGFHRIALVTDSFHMSRAMVLANRFIEADFHPVSARNFDKFDLHIRLRLLSREALSWWWNAGKLAAWEGLGLLGYSEAERIQQIR